MENKIIILVIYFGKLPKYFTVFWDSCRKNPKIVFIFFGDCFQVFSQKPFSNFRFENISFKEFLEQAEKSLKIPIKMVKPYKICDFRVVLPVIFEKYIKNYSFWGWCDIDLVFGDIQIFAPLEILENYVVFICFYDNVSGPFTHIRNVPRVNQIISSSSDLVRFLQDPYNKYNMCECAKCWNGLKKNIPFSKLNPKIESLTEILLKCEKEKKI